MIKDTKLEFTLYQQTRAFLELYLKTNFTDKEKQKICESFADNTANNIRQKSKRIFYKSKYDWSRDFNWKNKIKNYGGS